MSRLSGMTPFRAVISLMAVIGLVAGSVAVSSASMASGSVSAQAAVAKTVPLVTKLTVQQPSCRVAAPKFVVRTSSDLSLGYAKSRSEIIWPTKFGDVPAGTYSVALPAMSRGASATWWLVVQVLDDHPRFYGPYKFHRLSNTNCLVRAIQPTRTVASPKAWVHLEGDASIGITHSKTSAIHWVKFEKPAGWYLITFPAMSRGTAARWYIVLRFLDDSAKRLDLGPLVYHRP